ncbi:hypothetical protein BGZ94_000138, partial [Podila epigama]
MFRSTTSSVLASSTRMLRQPLRTTPNATTFMARYKNAAAASATTRMFSISSTSHKNTSTSTPSAATSTPASAPRHPRVLVTGSLGQLGSGLVKELRRMYGSENVVASDIRKASDEFMATGPFVYADVMNYSMLERIVVDWRI